MEYDITNPPETGILDYDMRGEFQAHFPQNGFTFLHNLCERPEFQLPRLVELARRLPANEVECHAGALPVDQNPDKYPDNGLSIVETVRRIEHCESWLVLKNVQTDPTYGNLLRSVLNEVYSRLDSSIAGMHREEAFIFVSSPNSVTPYHLDEEHNFLLQIRGSKQVSMWDPRDRTVLSECQAEHMLQIWHSDNYHRNMSYSEEFQKKATVFSLHAGEGLHFPVGAPHWVKNGPDVSVSFSVTFRSAMSERQAIIYFINRKLRSIGIAPVPPGQAEWRDSLKYRLFQAVRLAARTTSISRLMAKSE